MNKFIVAMLVAIPLATLSVGNVYAAEKSADKPAKKSTALGTCSKEAKSQGLKGAERKAYIKQCTAAKKKA
jgi:hypothetical protein